VNRTLALAAWGTVAGAFSGLVFCVIHQVAISSIWFAVGPMLIAGAVCGTCVAWSYALVVKNYSVRSWAQYNALYVAALVGLGVTSLIMFEPVTTIPALLQSDAPPRALIGKALPVTGGFTAACAVVLTLLYRPGWRGAGAILLTTAFVVLFLGLNISILGLVSVPKSMLHVLAEVLGLIVSLALVYAGTLGVIWRCTLRRATTPPNQAADAGAARVMRQ
jgi:hypothetical protein